MKRLFEFLFVILILVSFMFGSIGVTPAYAASTMEIVPLSLPAGWLSGHLNSIWGSSASDAYAVGYGSNGSVTLPLLYYNGGNGWSASSLPVPDGWRSGYLFSVWGTSASDVYAVGSGYTGSGYLPLLYHKDSLGWNVYSFPLPAGLSSGYLYGVWGSSSSDVYAVGYGSNGSTTMPLLYHNNGSSWSEAGLSIPVGWSSVNFRVAWGSAANDVYIVGYGDSGNSLLPIQYHKGPSGWTAFTYSLPPDWLSGYSYGVWGSSASDIYTVGFGNNGSTTIPLVYHNQGSDWTASPLSLPDGWGRGYLYGIWGSSATDVYVVGSGNNGTQLLPLLYQNDGTGWREASPSLPVGWSFGYLQSVWGSGAGDVYAVGTGNNGSANLPLLYHSSSGGQDLLEPGNVTDLTAMTGTFSSSVKLSWTAPADDYNDPNSGPVASYLVKYSTSPFQSWSDGIPVTTGLPVPTAPDTAQTMTVSGLDPNTLYYFAVRAQDNQYNLSTNYTTASAMSSGIISSTWYIFGIGNFSFGEPGDVPVAADYSGDGRTDITVFRASTSTWYISNIGSFLFGEEGDIPVVADYNGDGRDDIAVFRASTSTWYISSTGIFLFGEEGDIPVPADYNGDGRADIAVFRPSDSTWYISGVGNFLFGEEGDIPVPADYNGDGRADIAVFRPSDGTWYISSTGNFRFGEAGDIPVVGDYNGDGRPEIAVFRP